MEKFGLSVTATAAVPLTTTGMGNPEAPSMSDVPGDIEGSKPGSGDLLAAKSKKEKRKKSIKYNE